MSTAQTWDPATYARNARFVSDLGAPVVALLAPKAGERILDLGCGDGVLTKTLADLGCEVVAVDSSAPQVEAARTLGLDARVLSGEDLPFDQEFDAVFSNAVLHWIKRADPMIASVYRALKPGGRFVAEMGGKGNTASILAITKRNPWYFPSIGEYASLLEQHGIEVTQAMLFERPTPVEGENGLRDWLRMFYKPPLPEDLIAAAETELRPKLFRDGTWYIDYRRLRVIAKRV